MVEINSKLNFDQIGQWALNILFFSMGQISEFGILQS